MEEYTWDDIIINPTLEEARNCIGKEVYYDDSPTSCLYCANNDTDYYMILKEIEPDKSYPFILENNLPCACIILKKGKKPEEYVPFDNIEELVEASLEHNKNHYLSKIGGIWLKNNGTGVFKLITVISPNNRHFLFDVECSNMKNVLDKFCFLDDTPCGKLKESKK